VTKFEAPAGALNYRGRDEEGEPTWLLSHEYYLTVYLVRALPDGREIVVLPWSGAGAQLSIGYRADGCYMDTWDYQTVAPAVSAAKAWDGTGEPAGWYRHPFTGRRRPGGDPAQEFVRP
jgi:hypothetical protein